MSENTVSEDNINHINHFNHINHLDKTKDIVKINEFLQQFIKNSKIQISNGNTVDAIYPNGYCEIVTNVWYEDLTPLGYIPCVLKCYQKDKFLSRDYTGLRFHNKSFTQHVFFLNKDVNNPSVIDPLLGTYFFCFELYAIFITQLLENHDELDDIIIEYHEVQKNFLSSIRHNPLRAQENGLLVSEGINIPKNIRDIFKITKLNAMNIRIIDKQFANVFKMM